MLNRLLCLLLGHSEGLAEYRRSISGDTDTVLHHCVRCERIVRTYVVPVGAVTEWDQMWSKPFDWEGFNRGK